MSETNLRCPRCESKMIHIKCRQCGIEIPEPQDHAKQNKMLQTLLSDIRLFLTRYRSGVIEHAEAVTLQYRIDDAMSAIEKAHDQIDQQAATILKMMTRIVRLETQDDTKKEKP